MTIRALSPAYRIGFVRPSGPRRLARGDIRAGRLARPVLPAERV